MWRIDGMMASHNVSLPSFQMPDFLQSFLEILVGIGLLFAGGEVFVPGVGHLSLIFGIPSW